MQNIFVLSESMKCLLAQNPANVRFLTLRTAAPSSIPVYDVRLACALHRRVASEEAIELENTRQVFTRSIHRLAEFEAVVLSLRRRWRVSIRELTGTQAGNGQDFPFRPEVQILLCHIPQIFHPPKKSMLQIAGVSKSKTTTTTSSNIPGGKEQKGSTKDDSAASAPPHSAWGVAPRPSPNTEVRAVLSMIPETINTRTGEVVGLELHFPDLFSEVIRRDVRLHCTVTLNCSKDIPTNIQSTLIGSADPPKLASMQKKTSGILNKSLENLGGTLMGGAKTSEGDFVGFVKGTRGRIEEFLPVNDFEGRNKVSKIAMAVSMRLQRGQKSILDFATYAVCANLLSNAIRGEIVTQTSDGKDIGAHIQSTRVLYLSSDVRAVVTNIGHENIEMEIFRETENSTCQRAALIKICLKSTKEIHGLDKPAKTIEDILGRLLTVKLRRGISGAWLETSRVGATIYDCHPAMVGVDSVRSLASDTMMNILKWVSNILFA